MYSENFYVVKYVDSNIHVVRVCPEDKNPNEWVCCEAAEVICFSDCGDERVVFICVNGRELEYVGWQPGMLYEFIDAETREVVYSRSFSNWDH